jgi:RNA polymerase sigma-70 factor (ECF subfamily)
MERRFSPPSDEQLLATYADTGNHLAFEELVHRYERGLRSYLRQYLGDAQLAEDAFQATFLQVHLKCRQFARDRRLQPWLYTIAAHQAVDLLRRNRRHKAMSRGTVAGDGGSDAKRPSLDHLLETRENDPGERLNRSEDRDWIRAALLGIPAKVRQVLILVVYKGLSYREAADAIGIPLGTLKSRMNAAVSCLHKALIAARHRAPIDSRRCRPHRAIHAN